MTSLPARGAWIEIGNLPDPEDGVSCRSPRGERGLKSYSPAKTPYYIPSLPARGAWIEILSCRCPEKFKESLPARGAWIEIVLITAADCMQRQVAPREGSVD